MSPTARSSPARRSASNAVLLRDLRIVALVRLHERGVGEELDTHRMVELQLPVLLDERHVLRDPGIPSLG